MKIVPALLAIVACGCGRDAPSATSTPVSASRTNEAAPRDASATRSTTTASASPPRAPIQVPAAGGSRIAVHPLPAWTSPPETLVTRNGPVWQLHQTSTHVAWVEPQESRNGRFPAMVSVVAKSAPSREEVVANVPVDSTYTRSTALVSSGTNLFLLPPGPGDARYATATVLDPTTRTARPQPLPANVSVFNDAPVAAAINDTLVVASEVVGGSATLNILAPGAAPRTVHVDGYVTQLASHGGDFAVVYNAPSSGAVAARLELGAGKLEPLLTRAKLIESIAVDRGSIVWSELEQDPGFRINSIFLTGANGTAKALGKMEIPHHAQIAGDRACWATLEPRGGPTAYDAKQNPVGVVDTFVVCASLATGALERAVGPLAQSAVGFVLDEHHVYWAEVTGNTTTLKRRAR